MKGIFTDDDSLAPPPPDPSQCEAEARDGGLSFAGGDGTEDTPFEVSSPEQLANIGQLLYCNFRLTRNIDLSVVANWTPLGAESPCDGGNDDACFQGKLDGNGKMISDLTVNITEDYGGLFGYTGEHAEIRSVALSDVSVMARNNAGGLAGTSHGSISNSYVTGAVSGRQSVGGLVGDNDGSISSSYSISTPIMASAGNIGGLVGINGGSISNSYATGAVSASPGNNTSSLGGLVGRVRATGSISSSYSTGMVTAALGFVPNAGGLVGINGGSISNSYASGTANSSVVTVETVSGLVGSVQGGSTINGINYFADDVGGPDGIEGSDTCTPGICTQATGGDDAARATWLADSLDETLDSGLNWDAELDAEGNAVWGDLNTAGFPCLKNMPAGAVDCL